MVKKIRPQYTINPLMMEIWPLDKFSRTLIIKALYESNLTFDFNPTTMGEPAIKFTNNKHYEQAIKIIKDIEIEN